MKIEDFKKLANTKEKEIAISNCIFLARVGSNLYGTRTENSDEDFTGCFIEPEEFVLGRKNIEVVEFKSNPSNSGGRNKKGDLDATFYGLKKWFSLLEGNNPNQLELFFVNDLNLIHTTEFHKQIINNKNLFISKKLKHSFSGYAYSQLNRNEIKSGNQTGRKHIIEKFGFDTKLVSHALRLYIESLDLLVQGFIEFPLHNNQELIDIKNGLYSYEKIKERCAFYEPLIEKAYIESKLQNSPNHEEISKLQIDLYKKYFNF